MVDVVPPWLPVPGEPLLVGLTPVLPDEGTRDAGGGGADVADVAGLELPDAGAAVLRLGLAVLAGLELAGQEGLLVA